MYRVCGFLQVVPQLAIGFLLIGVMRVVLGGFGWGLGLLGLFWKCFAVL